MRRGFAAYTSDVAAAARRALARARGLGRPRLLYFHEVGDPYSGLVAQRLPAILARYGARLEVALVGPPADDAVPERDMLAAYARLDAERLARAHGLRFEDAGPARPDAVEAVARYVAGGADAATRLARVERTRESLWRGATDDVAALAGGRVSVDALAREHARSARRRARAGHYLGGVVFDGGELFWGVDRLPHLERALGGEPRSGPVVSPLTSSLDAPVDTFFSFRSPYSYLAIERIRRGPRPSRFRLRPVLPMVMRGLPAPRVKRMYILRDVAREARRWDVPFGFGVDPVGAGVERCIAVFFAARERGLELELAASCYRAIFAEGVDVATDPGLRFAVERVGLDWPTAAAALARDAWRERAEENRKALASHGLWGVPTFVREGEAVWGRTASRGSTRGSNHPALPTRQARGMVRR